MTLRAIKKKNKKRGSGTLLCKRTDRFSELCFLVDIANSKGQNVVLILHLSQFEIRKARILKGLRLSIALGRM